jgi:hypothetical protein
MQVQLTYYSKQGLYHAMNIYREIDYIPLYMRSMAIRYLYQYRHHDPYNAPTTSEIEGVLLKQFNIHRTNLDTAHQSLALELMDIALQFCPTTGDAMLDQLRVQRVELTPFSDDTIEGTMYDDTQNVHNSTFNRNVKDVAVKLSIDYPQWKQFSVIRSNEKEKARESMMSLWENTIIVKLLRQCEDTYCSVLIDVIRDIHNNSATFGIDLRVEDLMVCIWYWHLGFQGESRITLHKRMVEELLDMKGYCSTGHLARLINVTQGFDDRYQVRISIEDQCKSVVYKYLTTIMKQCEDDDAIMDSMISSDRTIFIEYIYDHVRLKRDEWNSEYGEEFTNYVEHYVTKFIG